MRYAIVINLDYNSYPEQECLKIWTLIRNRMINSGFRLEGRLFTAEMSEDEACKVSREVMDKVNKDPGFMHDGDIFNFIKDFYCYNHSHTVNLLLPPTENIKLE